MSKKGMRKIVRSCLCFLMALLLAFQGTGSLFVQAKETVENSPRDVDMSRPEALTSKEAGIEEPEPENVEAADDKADGETKEDSPADQEEGKEEVQESEEPQIVEETQEPEETAEMEEPSEPVEIKEPADYYPLPKEPDGELIEYDKKSRTYKTGEKEYTTVIGGYVGVYEDEEGKMQLVDNTLEESEEESPKPQRKALRARSKAEGEPAEELDTGVYQNKANDYVVQLPKNITQEAGMVIEKDDFRIEIVPLGGDYTHSAVKGNAILYNQVYEGVDVQYTVIDHNIKEDIVLNKPIESAVFEYELRNENLKAELKDNQVYLYPGDKTIDDAEYVLEAPSMEDAAGAVDFNIVLELREEEDGRSILTVKPDAEWLASEERQYPVRVDPSTVSIGKEAFNLNGVEQGSPTTYIGDNNYPYVGYDDGIKSGNLSGYGTMHMICRTYIKVNYDFSNIPQDSKIDSATFSVSQRTAYSGGASQFGLYRIDDAWGLPLKWTNQPMNHTFIDVQNASAVKNAYINYDVKALVNDWVQGTYVNNGMVLKAIDEASGQAAAMQCEVLNNRNSPYGPSLTVQWSPAEDPFLRDMSIDDTTILLRPMTEKSLNGKLQFDAVFVDGLAKSKSEVEYYLVPDEEKEHHTTDAKPLYTYPDSTEFNVLFPAANKYYSKDTNWQSDLYIGLEKDKLYLYKAYATKEIDGETVTGKEVTSDSFVIYGVKQFDTFPKIAKYYGVPLKDIMKDNQVQDALVVENNTIFIRNPQTNVPYNPPPLTDIDKMKIDGALLGRGLHCEFGFEPVNLNTGNFYMDQADVSMKELNGEFSIIRSYNSKGTDQNSMFGRGWSFNYDQSLVQMEDGSILYMRGDGSYLFFEKKEDGSYSCPAGYEYALKPVTYEGTDHDEIGWEIKDAAQSTLSFDKYGVLRFITDVDGFVTRLDYSEEYNLNKIVTPSGKEFAIEQNEFGYITGITLPDGSKLAYSYDENGNLATFTDANGGMREYQYDDTSRMTSWKDENGNTVVTNTYDDDGRVVEQTDANGGTAVIEYQEGKTVTVDNEGNRTAYSYDGQYRTKSITYPNHTMSIKSYNRENQLEREVTAKGTKTYTYDDFGNIATETREDGCTASYAYNAQNKLVSATNYNGALTTYEYDGGGNLAAVNQPDKSRITYTSDNFHRITSMTDGRGITSTYGYDGANLTSYTDGEGNVWKFTYDDMNRAVSKTDPLGNTESISYNARGEVIAKTAADGGVEKYGLDGVGNIVSITDPLGKTTTFTYDAMYNMVQGTDSEGHSISYEYDKNYREILSTDAKGNTIASEYDKMGRLIKETNQDFGTRQYGYDVAGNRVSDTDGEGNTTSYEYNALGLPTKVTDALGSTTQYSYDPLGNETKVSHADGAAVQTSYDSMGRVVSATDELGATVSYQYDANGNVTSVSDDSGRTYCYEYDRNNNPVKKTNPEGGVSVYTYDGAGRMVSYTNEEGQTEVYSYDGAGRAASVTNDMGIVYANEYDQNGSLISSTDGNGNTSSYTYNGVGSLTSVTDPLGNITAFKYDVLDNLKETVDALKGKTKYSYDSRGNVTKMTDPLGNVYTYRYDKNGNNTGLTGPQGAEVTMKYDAAGQLIFAGDAQGLEVTYQYDAMGQVTRESDNTGNSTDYTYDGAGNLTSRTDQIGRTTKYTYDKYGRLLEIKEADGSITSYEYDVMDRLTAVTDAEGNRTEFAYDKAGNLLTMTEGEKAVYRYTYDKKNRVSSATDPIGAVRKFAYDGNDNLLEAVDENGVKTTYEYDANDNLVRQTDGNGNAVSYQYDELDRKIKEISPMEEVSEYRYDALGNLTKYQDPMGLVTEYKYDSLSNLVEELSPKGAVTRYGYDKHGNVVSVTDAMGNETAYSMDLNDRVTKITQPNGGEYSYDYDEVGRLKSMVSPLGYQKNFTYDTADNVVKETDSLKSVDVYTYDRLHRMVSSTNALDGTSRYQYDRHGNLTQVSDSVGRTENYTYDLAGRMVQAADPMGKITKFTYDPVGNITTVTKPGDRETRYGYDKNYNITSVTDPMGYAEQFVYDKSNRMVEEIDTLEQKISYKYDKDGRVTEVTNKSGYTAAFDYDPHGNILVKTDRTGLKTHYEYDVNDNLTKVTDPLGGITSYAYDNMDQMVSYTDASGKITAYTYDLEGNLTSLTDPAGRTEEFAYDEKGRLTAHTAASGKKVSYDYDKLNDLLEKSYTDARGKETEKAVAYAYNSAGERVSMKDQTGKSFYEYDGLGRIVKVTDGSGKEVSYTYDKADNLQNITYPDGTEVSYEYDLNDNLVKVTDRDGKVTEYKHDALNRVTETIRANGTKTVVSYDAEDHVTKLVNTCGTCGEVISSYEYQYNERGYIIAESAAESEAGTRKTPSFYDWYNWGGQKLKEDSKCCHEEKTIKTSRNYEYDGNWELVKCTEKIQGGVQTTHQYTYDKVGNRTYYERVEDGVLKVKYKYEYNDSNQLVKRTDCKIWGDKGACYKYDADGNLITSQENDYEEPVKYEYTAENRLKVVSQGGNVLMAAMYDGDNNRVFQIDNTYKWEDCYGKEVLIPESQRTEDGNSPKEQLAAVVKGGVKAKGYTLTEYVNDINRENAEVLLEYGADDQVRQSYVYGEERIQVDKTEENSYYLYNGQGSVSGLLKENGKLANSYRYDPYGNLTSGTPDAVNYYGYHGESTNIKTGFQYLRARYYAPATGRFTTEDPYLGNQAEPLSRNRYAYTENNPVNYADPTGYVKTAKTARSSRSGGLAGSLKNLAKSAVSVGKSVSRKVQSSVTAAKAVQAVKSNPNYGKSGSQKKSYLTQVSSAVSKISNIAQRVRQNIVRELCNSKEKVSKEIDWKKVGIIAASTAAVLVLGYFTGGAGLVAAEALGLAKGSLGAMVFGGAVSGAAGGAVYGVTYSTLSGNNPTMVMRDTLSGGASGAIWGGIFSAIGYAYIGPVTNQPMYPVNQKMEPGHIAKISTRDLASKTYTVWDNIIPTAENIPYTNTPATFEIKLNSNINYINPKTGNSSVWTNANATKHVGEYVTRFGGQTSNSAINSQIMLESYSVSLNQAMEDVTLKAPGRYFGLYGNWEIGVNTESGVVYHARMIK